MKNKELINKILKADKVFYYIDRGRIIIRVDQLALLKRLNINPNEDSFIEIIEEWTVDGVNKLYLKDEVLT